MMEIPGFQIQEKLYQNQRMVVYRGIREANQAVVSIKMSVQETPLPEDLEFLKNEYRITRDLELAGVIKAHELVTFQNKTALILEEETGQALQQFLDHRSIDMETFLKLSISLAKTLADLHQHKIIHQNIQPGNITIVPKTRQIKIKNFALASTTAYGTADFEKIALLADTLAYMSPEQTGRTNRAVDYRTDLYSLGITFYQMLTGSLPFEAEETVEMIHHHLAKAPAPPHLRRSEVPQMLSRIVLKLMEKSAEERYQSAHGVLYDLEKCLEQWSVQQTILDFIPAEQDHSGNLNMEDNLYAREQELSLLKGKFNELYYGQPEMVMVSGPPGTGKTVLLSHFKSWVLGQQGFFITGTCDVLKQDIPYYPLFKALQGFIQELLLGNPEQLKQWKARLLEHLQENGQLIVEVIPEVELIIGKQPEIQELPAMETQVRFQRVLQSFLQVFTSLKYPVVLHLDDMQWADYATLEFVKQLMTTFENPGLLFVGNFRNNEVPAFHPLMSLLNELKSTSLLIHEIALGSLPFAAVVEFLQITLGDNTEAIQPLAETIFQKTGGNPFFMKLFLKNLHEKQLLTFDHQLRKWHWDLEEIQDLQITDNVVDLLSAKIRSLPEMLQQVLKFAACIGSHFDLLTIATLLEIKLPQIASDLWIAVQEGLLVEDAEYVIQEDQKNFLKVPLDPLEKKGEIHSDMPRYRFIHERVRQAAYAMISEQEKIEAHWKIGKFLAQSIPEEKLHEQVFNVVNHLNWGKSLLDNLSDRERLIQLNLLASKKAKKSTAYPQALNYLRVGMELLPLDSWSSHYEATLEFHLVRSECEYLTQNYEEASRLFEIIAQNTRNVLDLIKVNLLKMQLNTTLGMHEKNIQVGMESLKLLRVEMPDQFGEKGLVAGANRLVEELNRDGMESLLQLPPMTDSQQIAIMNICFYMGASAYAYQTEILWFTILEQINRTRKFGNFSSTALAYSGMGLIARTILHDADASLAFGKLAIECCEQSDDPSLKCRVYHNCTFIVSFYKHFQDCLPYSTRAFQYGLQAGNLLFAGYAIATKATLFYLMDANIKTIEEECKNALGFVQQIQDKDDTAFLSILKQILRCFQGQTNSSASLSDASFHEERMVTELKAGNSTSTLLWYYILKLGQLVIFQHYQEALQVIKIAEGMLNKRMVGLNFPDYYFYASLTFTALYPRYTGVAAQEIREKIELCQQELKELATDCPENFQHQYLLVEAERTRLSDSPLEALDYYLQAIESAKKHHFWKNLALAHEMAARFHREQGFDSYARLHFTEARRFYHQWGALGKVKELEKQYRLYLDQDSHVAFSNDASGNNERLQGLDVTAIMKASQSISEEIVLDRLLESLLRILIENAGAQRGALILIRDGRYCIEASGEVGKETIINLDPTPLEHPEISGKIPPVPVKLIQYVAKTKEAVLLNDAAQEGRFIRIPYIVKNQTKSILCSPILQKGEVVGIIYLENNLTTGAFTPARLEIANLLTAQAAISLENANLYQAYGNFVPHEFLGFLKKKNIMEVQLGNQIQQEMSILFSDIRSFTTLSEGMSPQDNFNFLNAYFEQMGPVVRQHHGLIDKYIGDAIMALFDRCADDAVQAAIAMLQQLTSYNTFQMQLGFPKIEIGLGIHSGSVMLGTIGETHRMESTVIGDVVNLASRVESLTKLYDTPLLITEKTLLALQDVSRYCIRFIDRVRVKGKAQTINLFEVFDTDPEWLREQKHATRIKFEQAWNYYQQQEFREARRQFRRILKKCPNDQVVKIYVDRCQQLIKSGVEEDWDGSIQLSEK